MSKSIVTPNVSSFVTAWKSADKAIVNQLQRMAAQYARGVKSPDLLTAITLAVSESRAGEIAATKLPSTPVFTESKFKQYNAILAQVKVCKLDATNFDIVSAAQKCVQHSRITSPMRKLAFKDVTDPGAFIRIALGMVDEANADKRAATKAASEVKASADPVGVAVVEDGDDAPQADALSVVMQAQGLIVNLAKVFKIASSDDKKVIAQMVADAFKLTASK